MRFQKTWAALSAAALLGIAALAGSASPATAATNQNAARTCDADFRNVMYYGNWGLDGYYPRDLPADKWTHLNYAFIDFDADGSLRWTAEDAVLNSAAGESSITPGSASSGILNALQQLRLTHPNLKIGVSVGGWTKSGDFPAMTADPEARARFVRNIVDFARWNEMDFIDIDWEYPGSIRDSEDGGANDEGHHGTFADFENYVKLMRELREATDKLTAETGKPYQLSIAATSGQWFTWDGAPWASNQIFGNEYIEQVFKYIDFANIMTYDMTGGWVSLTSHHTPLSINPEAPNTVQWNGSIENSMNFYLNNGAPAEKLHIGAAFYTRGFGGVNNDGIDPENLPGLYASHGGLPADGHGGVVPYRDLPAIREMFPGLKEYWDEGAKAPYLYSEEGQVFYSLDTVRSLKLKGEYVQDQCLGGIITWMASQDVQSDPNSPARDKLTNAIFEGMYGADAKLPTRTIQTQPLNVSAHIDYDRGPMLVITNNEHLTATDRVLVSVERRHKTVKNPIVTVRTTAGNMELDLRDFGISEIAPGQTVEIRVGVNPATLTSIDLQQRIADIAYGTQNILSH